MAVVQDERQPRKILSPGGRPRGATASADRVNGTEVSSTGGKCQANQGRKRLRAGLLHDSGAMVLHRALTDQLHDLALTRRQAGEALDGRLWFDREVTACTNGSRSAPIIRQALTAFGPSLPFCASCRRSGNVGPFSERTLGRYGPSTGMCHKRPS
jgi:hypothetical protein